MAEYLHNPITQRLVKVGSNSFKALTRDTTFTHDKNNKLLVPNDKTNYTFDEKLKRWIHNDYGKKAKKKRLPPINIFSKPKPEKMEMQSLLKTINESSPARAPHWRPRVLATPALGELPLVSKPKVRPEKVNMQYSFISKEMKAPESSYKSNRNYKILNEISNSEQYKNILDILDTYKNRLYYDDKDKKRLQYTLEGSDGESLSNLFRTFENIDSKEKLDKAVKAYNTIFKNLQLDIRDVKKIENYSSAKFFIRDFDEILSTYGATLRA
jgi:hypothetical protein